MSEIRETYSRRYPKSRNLGSERFYAGDRSDIAFRPEWNSDTSDRFEGNWQYDLGIISSLISNERSEHKIGAPHRLNTSEALGEAYAEWLSMAKRARRQSEKESFTFVVHDYKNEGESDSIGDFHSENNFGAVRETPDSELENIGRMKAILGAFLAVCLLGAAFSVFSMVFATGGAPLLAFGGFCVLAWLTLTIGRGLIKPRVRQPK